MIRNITFLDSVESTGTPEPTPEVSVAEVTLRTRTVTVSPQEEYQLRDGEVRPISNELAAAILSYKGRAIVGNKGVVVDRKDIGGKYVYFHEHSVTLNDFASRERKLYYVINRLTPEVLHLLDETGTYIESLPLRERPAVLDNEAQAEQLRQNKAIVNRAARRLQDLHQEDTREALDNLAANSAEMTRVVVTLPAPDAAPAAPMRSPQGEVIAEVTRQTAVRISHERAAGSPSDIVRRRARETKCPF